MDKDIKKTNRIEEVKFYAGVLRSEECQCGKHKNFKQAFCFKCYFSLPEHMQKALYQQLLQGFGEAYEEAAEYLRSI